MIMKQETEMQILERLDTKKILEELQPFPPQLLDLIRKAMQTNARLLLVSTLFKLNLELYVQWFTPATDSWYSPQELTEKELTALMYNPAVTQIRLVNRKETWEINL